MINNIELMEIKGGGLSTTIANTIVKVITTAMEFGRTVGTAIRRAINKSKC